MEKDVFILNSNTAGPKVTVFAGVHGNEICGIKALDNIISKINIDTGSVTFVYANPQAIEKNVRFTEFNLNRAFKEESFYSEKEKQTYEYKRAQELKTILDNADILLDIHSSFTKESEPFIICEKNADNIVKTFPAEFNKIVYGFDTVQPGGTDWYMNTIRKIGICIECGYHYDPNAVNLAEKTIIDFLSKTGNIINNNIKNQNEKELLQITEMYITKTDNFSLVKDFTDFEKVTTGQTIGYDGDEKVTVPFDGVILFARSRDAVGAEGFLLAKITK